MIISVITNNVILMWAAIEATTLSSAFLVGTYKQKTSLEAAWKYIIICSGWGGVWIVWHNFNVL